MILNFHSLQRHALASKVLRFTFIQLMLAIILCSLVITIASATKCNSEVFPGTYDGVNRKIDIKVRDPDGIKGAAVYAKDGRKVGGIGSYNDAKNHTIKCGKDKKKKVTHADFPLVLYIQDKQDPPRAQDKYTITEGGVVTKVRSDYMNVSLYRQIDYSAVGLGFEFGVTLDLDIFNETGTPSNVTVLELLPEDFTWGGSWDPSPQFQNATEARWVFLGGDVQNRSITYTVTAPYIAAGLYYFDGFAFEDGLEGIAVGDFEITFPVGGIGVPVDKLALLAPYIALTSTILVATAATAIYVKRRNKKK